MKYSLDEFLALPADEQSKYWYRIDDFVSCAHMTYCSEAVEANTDSSIGSGRIPQPVNCDCKARKL